MTGAMWTLLVLGFLAAVAAVSTHNTAKKERAAALDARNPTKEVKAAETEGASTGFTAVLVVCFAAFVVLFAIREFL